MSRLSIILFGPLEARLDGEPLGGFEYNKVRALLAYLAVETGRQHTRASLSTLLWPELADSAARQNLSQALTTLRKVLGDKQAEAPFLITTTEFVQLNPAAPYEVDVLRFATLIAAAETHQHRAWHLCSSCAARLSTAVALYRDDFLAQLYVSDSAPFEEWALLLRERLRQRMLSALERLSQYTEWRGAFDEAAAYVRRQVELEPLRDSVHRELMRLLALSGQQAAALAQYDYLRRTLLSELDDTPEDETTDLYEQIRSGDRLHELRHLQPPASHLPAPPSALIGREAEVERVCEQLGGSGPQTTTRALTITGPPGVGKTRLAQEVAARLRYDYEDGVHMVELAPVADAADVASAVAQVLGVSERGTGRLAEAVRAHLHERHALLVLDNFEHVLDAASFVAGLLTSCPALNVLLTSRAPLHLRAEHQYPLDALSLPSEDADITHAQDTEAVQLFVDRARAARPGFTLTPENVATVAAVCRRAEGLPLTLELIAPRLKSLSPAEVLRQLESRLSGPATGPRDAPERHRTLRNAIQWSYDRLSMHEQDIFAQLGVFAGGCTAEALQAVVGEPTPVLPALEALHDASLLHTQSIADETRFVLLETIREFALEVLTASSSAHTAQQRHAIYFAGVADAAERQLLGAEQPRWSARIAAEMDNLRAALRWSLQHNEFETAQCIAGGVWRFWWQRGLLREGLGWLESALARREEPSLILARALKAAGVLSMGVNDHPAARQWLEDARNIALHLEEAEAYAAATTNLGLVSREMGDLAAATTYLEESLELARSMEPIPAWIKFPMLILARVYAYQGNTEQAALLFDECLMRNRELGDAEGTADALQGVASIASARGEYERARQLCDESLAIYTSLNHQYGIGWSYAELGHLARTQGEYAEALAQYLRCLTIWIEREDNVAGAQTLDDAACVLALLHQWSRSVCVMSAAAAIRRSTGVVLSNVGRAEQEQNLALCRTALGDDAYTAAWDTGEAMSLEQAVQEVGAGMRDLGVEG